MTRAIRRYKIPRPYSRLGTYLGKLRRAEGLTQREVAAALGYSSAQFVSNFERGIAAPPVRRLQIYVSSYGADIERLVKLRLAGRYALLAEALYPRQNGRTNRPAAPQVRRQKTPSA